MSETATKRQNWHMQNDKDNDKDRQLPARDRGEFAGEAVTDPEGLTDDELAAQAAEWRRRALHGEHDANGRAHVLERELRRRSGALSTLGAELRNPARRLAPWWAFWRR